MQFYSDKSENARLVVGRFLDTFDALDPLFLSGAPGSEYGFLIKEYCLARNLDVRAVVNVPASMLDESPLADMLLMLNRAAIHASLLVVHVKSSLDVVSERKLMRFLDNPAIHDAKLLVVMDGFDPFGEGNAYPVALAERAKQALFVLPPLRTRLADLAFFTVRLFETLQAGKKLASPLRLSDAAGELWMGYDWPGNFEELHRTVAVLVEGSHRGGTVERDRLLEVLHLGRTSEVTV
jgi:hypothetical protein